LSINHRLSDEQAPPNPNKIIRTSLHSTFPPKKNAECSIEGGEYFLFQVKRAFRLGLSIRLYKFYLQYSPGISKNIFFFTLCSVMYVVVPGTFETGLFNLPS